MLRVALLNYHMGDLLLGKGRRRDKLHQTTTSSSMFAYCKRNKVILVKLEALKKKFMSKIKKIRRVYLRSLY